jgi:hypothetical protein
VCLTLDCIESTDGHSEIARNTKTPHESAAFDPDSHRAEAAKQLGIKDGVEDNYISTGDDLVLLDSPEWLAMLSAMHGEGVG